jgi:DNA polymerase (family 10)
MGELFAAAAEHKVALEINSHWLRLDMRDTHVRGALAAGCLLAIDCDVHGRTDFDHLRYGVLTGRRGGLTPERCVNTWSKPALHKWLASKRG